MEASLSQLPVSPSKCRKMSEHSSSNGTTNGHHHDTPTNDGSHDERENRHRGAPAPRNGASREPERRNGSEGSGKKQKPVVASYSLLNLQMQKMSEEGKRVYNMSIGQSPFPVMRVMVDELGKQCHQGQYAPVMGVPDLRSAICEFHRDHDDVRYEPEDVVVGPGSKLLIDILISVFDGDIVVTSPSWPSYNAQCNRSGKPFLALPTYASDRWTLRSDVLEQYLASRADNGRVMLILCSPNNPAGTTYTETDYQKLSVVFRKYDVTVLSDEIYARLYSDHVPAAKYYPEGTILSSGFSKWAAIGGWRIGYHMFPPALHHLRDTMINIGTHTYSCCPAPVQLAVLQTLRCKSSITEYLHNVRRILTACVRYTYSELSAVGVNIVAPSGGYFILADFGCIRESLSRRGIRTGTVMCQKILEETNVGFVAGSSFYRPVEELSVRLVLVCFDGEKALTASRADDGELGDEFVEKHCEQLHSAVQILKQWVISQN